MPMPPPNRPPPAGFTLIELLVVIGIIAVLASLLVAALGGVLKKSDQTKALNNVRQLGTALALYTADNSYTLPGRMHDATANKWPIILATYLKDDRVFAAPGLPNWITQKLDPQSNAQNNTSYLMNGFNDQGAYEADGLQIRLNRFEHLSQVILFGMQINSGNFYMDFVEKNQNDVLKLDAYNGGSIYLFADSSARFITKADYEAPYTGEDAGGNGAAASVRYGDWLWLADKSAKIPQ